MSLEKIVFSLPNPPPKWHPSFNLVHTEQICSWTCERVVWRTKTFQDLTKSSTIQTSRNASSQSEKTAHYIWNADIYFRHQDQKREKKYRDAWNKCTENKLFHSHVCEIKEMHDTQEWMRLTGLYCFYHLDERCPRSAKQDIHTVKTSTTDSNIHLVSYKWDSNANIHTLQQQDVYFFY